MEIDKRLILYAEELLEARASHEIEDIITPYGEKTTALRVCDRAHFVKLMTDFMIAEGMAKPDEFKDVDQTDVADFRSMAYLNFLYTADADRRHALMRQQESDRSAATRKAATEDRIRNPPEKIDPDLKQRLLGELRARPKPLDPREAGRKAAENVRRIMRGDP